MSSPKSSDLAHLSEGKLSRREALVAIGKAGAGLAVVAVAIAAGAGGYYYLAQSVSSKSQSSTSAPSSSSSSSSSSSQSAEPGFTQLFDGATLDGWQQAGPEGFSVVNGMMQTHGGMGLLWYTRKQFADFVLKVDWMATRMDDNSGVFVRFPDPGNDPWVAVNGGYEIQIDDVGAPDGAMIHKTGAVYSFAAPSKLASNPVGKWNLYEIHVVGQSYRVILNGQEVTDFTGERSTKGYIGLQNHNGTLYFRNVRIMEL